VLVARDGKDVVEHRARPDAGAGAGDRHGARERILEEHTYERRGALVDVILREEVGRKRRAMAVA
jgi:hypothetical protein